MTKLQFPLDFVWGSATSSYQIEGAYDEDGKGESIWDIFSHTLGKINNNDTGDVACDHYHRYKEDIELMKEIGLDSYRFSISWPRILPNGKGEINQKGLNFYKELVDQLLEAGIEPVITLYHWDLPQALQEEGGWANRDTIKYFVKYAEVLFDELGAKVSQWITHNEPWVVSFLGYAEGEHAPGIKDRKQALQVAHNLLVSHGLVVKKFRELDLTGDIGITLNLTSVYSYSETDKDQEAAQLMEEYINGWFLDPVFKGSYPKKLAQIYENQFGKIDIQAGDMDLISQEIDFLGINYYSRALINYNPNSKFYGIESIKPAESDYTAMNWEIYPDGLYDLLTKLNQEYTNKPLYITENGAAFDDQIIAGQVNDQRRINYLKEHFKSVYRAIQDGVPVRGYYVWSLMDNFEWAYGYSKRFGLIYVDYNTQKRTLKDSAYWYQQVIEENSIGID
ncbi:beta-galactosidase [Halobacteroides halobius DSM 5150]|uniref:Beta-glucosidase n=1 Tax=Halobacteroides halobius (strain ATCC 35273 / DSM 5150 / MD-1) TaxID=748449 RepID=L0K7D4_HALHC|nr:GH1 family beta-glucosidase [Halobacteroides halobius]AGB40269.1 beta-galactosidase [Halobacteroides halobius DSM 5150]